MTDVEAEKEHLFPGSLHFWRYTTDPEGVWNLIPQDQRKKVLIKGPITAKMNWRYEDNPRSNLYPCTKIEDGEKFYYEEDPDQVLYDKCVKHEFSWGGMSHCKTCGQDL